MHNLAQRLRNAAQNFCDGWALTTLLLDPVQELEPKQGGGQLIRGGRLIRTLRYMPALQLKVATTIITIHLPVSADLAGE